MERPMEREGVFAVQKQVSLVPFRAHRCGICVFWRAALCEQAGLVAFVGGRGNWMVPDISQCAPPVRRGCGNRCRAHHGGFCLETFRKRQKAKRKKEERRSPVPSRTIRSLFSLHFAF